MSATDFNTTDARSGSKSELDVHFDALVSCGFDAKANLISNYLYFRIVTKCRTQSLEQLVNHCH
jgi:hypothetical protein